MISAISESTKSGLTPRAMHVRASVQTLRTATVRADNPHGNSSDSEKPDAVELARKYLEREFRNPSWPYRMDESEMGAMAYQLTHLFALTPEEARPLIRRYCDVAKLQKSDAELLAVCREMLAARGGFGQFLPEPLATERSLKRKRDRAALTVGATT